MKSYDMLFQAVKKQVDAFDAYGLFFSMLRKKSPSEL